MTIYIHSFIHSHIPPAVYSSNHPIHPSVHPSMHPSIHLTVNSVVKHPRSSLLQTMIYKSPHLQSQLQNSLDRLLTKIPKLIYSPYIPFIRLIHFENNQRRESGLKTGGRG